MAAFPSDEWLRTYKDAINASETYARLASEWEGDVAYVVEPEPDLGVMEESWGWVDLWHGTCRDARLVTPEEGGRSRYVIRAPYSQWKEVLLGRLDPIKAMTTGKLKLRGDLPEISRQREAVSELARIASGIPTTFPDA